MTMTMSISCDECGLSAETSTRYDAGTNEIDGVLDDGWSHEGGTDLCPPCNVLNGIVRLLEGMPCPECRMKQRVTEALRMPEHDYAGRRCRGSHLAVGWFLDGLAVIPYDRYHDEECIEARALLRRSVRPAAPTDRRSTSVVGDRPASGPTVSGGLPGSRR